MNDTFLTPDELTAITEYKRKDGQRKQLSRLGLKFQLTRTGRPLVLRSELHKKFGYEDSATSVEPDIESLRAITD